MPRLALALALALPLLAPPVVRAASCEKLLARLEAVEAQPATPRSGQRRLRIARRYADRCVALNQVQVLGTHNSYHEEARPDLMALLLAFTDAFEAVQYTHLPLGEQFGTQGIRQIELDVFDDPVGGLFGNRPVLNLVGDDPMGPPELFEPGLKVLHIQDVDFESTCLTFVQCLQDIKGWSEQNRGHLPLVVLVEVKDEAIPDPLNLGFAIPIPISAGMLDELDAEIRSVFKERELITPDSVRGDHDTLEEAILTDGWPLLGRAKNKVLFLMDNGGGVRALYRAGRPSLQGRVLFTNSTPGSADGAFVKRNDPIGDADIPALVSAGYLVRTRADADTVQARTGDTTDREAALGSGAQYVSTDYPEPDPRFTDYFVQIPDGSPGRCNPLNAPPGCRSDALERLR